MSHYRKLKKKGAKESNLLKYLFFLGMNYFDNLFLNIFFIINSLIYKYEGMYVN